MPSRPSSPTPAPFAANHRGTAVVEFALVTPLLLMMLLGIIAYGGYFWRAHALQQVANDAARAAIAGLTPTERTTLAEAVVLARTPDYVGVPGTAARVTVREEVDAIRVRISYDASGDPFFQMGIVPLPSPTIERDAIVRLGGL